jgi:hypothetical protein
VLEQPAVGSEQALHRGDEHRVRRHRVHERRHLVRVADVVGEGRTVDHAAAVEDDRAALLG